MTQQITFAEFITICNLAGEKVDYNTSHRNGSVYLVIAGINYRVSDHAQPAGMGYAGKEGLQDFRSYDDLLNDLQKMEIIPVINQDALAQWLITFRKNNA
jgi:hypothetical protein